MPGAIANATSAGISKGRVLKSQKKGKPGERERFLVSGMELIRRQQVITSRPGPGFSPLIGTRDRDHLKIDVQSQFEYTRLVQLCT